MSNSFLYLAISILIIYNTKFCMPHSCFICQLAYRTKNKMGFEGEFESLEDAQKLQVCASLN